MQINYQNRSWDPLERLRSSKPYENQQALLRFYAAHGKYKRKLKHVVICLNYIKELRKQYHETMTKFMKLTTNPDKLGVHTFTEEEANLFAISSELRDKLDLMNETFFIHTKILMDDMAQLAYFLLNDESTVASNNKYFNMAGWFKSFNEHRKWVLKQEDGLVPPKYQVLITSTNWFDIVVKFIRDKYYVHTLPRSGVGTKSSPQGDITHLFTIKNIKDEDMTFLHNLKQNYRQQYPEFSKISDNIYDILRFIDSNSNMNFKKEEWEKIKRIKGKGGELPKPENVLKHITLFINQFAELLEEKLLQKR
ncbi:MAG: hypothetical protein ACE5FT_04935 [Candidatus Nanoarchaeia archaeon]